MPTKKAVDKKPKGKLGKALDKLRKKDRVEEDDDDLVFESFEDEIEDEPIKEPPKQESPKQEPHKQEPKKKTSVNDIEKLIRKALQEELKLLEDSRESKKTQKQLEKEKNQKELFEKKALEKKKLKDEEKALAKLERQKEREEEKAYMAKLVLQREAELNRSFSNQVGRVRQRLMM